jgi:hypothetical protein
LGSPKIYQKSCEKSSSKASKAYHEGRKKRPEARTRIPHSSSAIRFGLDRTSGDKEMMVHQSADLAPFITLANQVDPIKTRILLKMAIERVTGMSHLADGEDRTMIQREIQVLQKLMRGLYPGE